MEREERIRAARQELAEWIDRNLDVLSEGGAGPTLPVVSDFVLLCAVESATDGPGEGETHYGRMSSGNAAYRIFGLLRAVEVVYATQLSEDD